MSRQFRKLRADLFRVGRFGVVGLVATLVHVLVFAGVMETVETPAALANLAAFAIALGVSYVGHACWTFRRSAANGAYLAKYTVLAVAGLMLNTVFAFSISDFLSMPYGYALIPMLLVTPGATYACAHRWVFG